MPSPRVTLSGPDLAKNRSRERILNLLEGKLDNAETTMKNNITKAVYGDGTVAKSFVGLKGFVTADGLGIIGGIDAGTWTFWKNQFQSVARATGLQYPGPQGRHERALDEADPGCRKTRSDRRRRRNLFAPTRAGLQENQRYADAKLGALGFETLKYKTAPLVFDGAATGFTGPTLPQHQIFEVRDLLGPQFREPRPSRSMPRHGRRDQASRVHGSPDPLEPLDAGRLSADGYLIEIPSPRTIRCRPWAFAGNVDDACCCSARSVWPTGN